MDLRIVTHYDREDTDFPGDYCEIEIFDKDGNSIAWFGDYYHDKGDEKVEGFIQGAIWGTGKKLVIKRESVADYDD